MSGSDDIGARPGFASMLKRIAGNGVRTIIVETANRFARDLIVQETACRKLRELGVDLIASDSPEAFVHDTPTAVMVRQILGAVAQFEKAALEAKLKGARDRKRAEGGRAEGRKPAHEVYPEAVSEAKRLRRASPKSGERMSFRDISAKLAAAGLVAKNGAPFTAMAIKRMVEGQTPSPETARSTRSGSRTSLADPAAANRSDIRGGPELPPLSFHGEAARPHACVFVSHLFLFNPTQVTRAAPVDTET